MGMLEVDTQTSLPQATILLAWPDSSHHTMHRTIKTTGIKLLVLLGAAQALVAGLGFAQQAPLAPLKPLKELLGPEEKLRGTWWSENAYGREYFTFGEKGSLIIATHQQQRDRMEYRLDTSVTPWKLILAVKRGEANGTIYLGLEFADADQLRMSSAVLEEKQLPTAAQLKEKGTLFHRVPWGPNSGIFQVVQAHVKGLEGTWHSITGGSKGTATFTKDGRYTLSEGREQVTGRYRIDVSTAPSKIDMLPDDGTGPLYGIYEIKDGVLRCSKGERQLEERVKEFEGAMKFVKEK